MTDICVIIAAMNAQDSIGRAVGSALAQPQVTEVVVVDDASTDRTSWAAEQMDDRSGRLKILRNSSNRGPAAARNSAISESTASGLAILDADDFLLEGRFDLLLAGDDDWDMSADNIMFIQEDAADQYEEMSAFGTEAEAERFSFERFVKGNISRQGHVRGELGFLKPVIRRSFLEKHGLRYDERLRLGEDFELYARMLLHGARFRTVVSCGYVAAERNDSLSVSHKTGDLEGLVRADERILARKLTGSERQILASHRAQCAARWHHRKFLDEKRERGLIRALFHQRHWPRLIFDAAKGIARDKARYFTLAPRGRPDKPAPRFLLDSGPEETPAFLKRT